MQSCDILIVGGGVMGVSIAHALAQRRVGRVVVLEKAFLGAGSSGKSGAIIRQHYSNRLTASMAQKSLRVFEDFEDVIGGPPVFTHTGMLVVVKEGDRAGLEANVAMQRELGIDVRLVSPQDVMELDPNARLAEDELAAVLCRPLGRGPESARVAEVQQAGGRRGETSAIGMESRLDRHDHA